MLSSYKKARTRREKQWAEGRRPTCKFHEGKIVGRAIWIGVGRRLCTWCFHQIPYVREARRRAESRRRWKDPEVGLRANRMRKAARLARRIREERV